MEPANSDQHTLRSTCAQVLATLAFNCLMVNVGLIIASPVIIIGALRLHDSSLSFTEEQASWFGGMIFMVQPLGSVVSGFLQDLLGRKTCMMAVNIPQLIAWLMMFYATSVYTLFAAVTILGLSIGFMEAPVLSYIGEISEPRLRGILSTFGSMFLNIGFVLIAVMGAAIEWRSMVLVSAAGSVVAFLALSLVPDSPAWLVTKGRVEDAQKAYQWLRGWVSAKAVQEELDALTTYVRQSRSPRVVTSAEYRAVSTNHAGSDKQHGKDAAESKLKIFLHPSVQRPLRLIVIYLFVAACASLCAMRPFFIEVLASMELPVRPHMVIVFGSGLTMLGALTATLTMRRVGKRGLTFLSLGLSVFCCLGLALYLALDLRLPWLPFMLFNLSSYAVPLGILTVPWILISELFPLRGRGVAGGVSAALGYLIMFIVIKTYYNIVSLVNTSGACFLYGTVGLLGFVYLYFHLPETEGVPLEVIEDLFSGGSSNKKQKRKMHEKLQMGKKEEVEVLKMESV